MGNPTCPDFLHLQLQDCPMILGTCLVITALLRPFDLCSFRVGPGSFISPNHYSEGAISLYEEN